MAQGDSTGGEALAGPRLHARSAEQLPITVLMNARSGSDEKSESQAIIESVLAESGRDVQILLAKRPEELPHLARRAAKQRGGILVSAGGDGTLNAIAIIAREHQVPLAVIPLGTFNYFARDLGVPLDTAAATRVVLEGNIRTVPVGEVNGLLFLNNASIGLYRRLIERRESDKQRYGRNQFVALLSALGTLLKPYRAFRMKLEVDGKPFSFSSPSVFFGRNALQMEQLGLKEARCVANGELAVLAPQDTGRFGLFKLLIRGALSRLDGSDELHQLCATTVETDLARRPRNIRVAVDGEIMRCTLPLIVRAVPDALQVVVPRTPEPRA